MDYQKQHLILLNQLFEIEKKTTGKPEFDPIRRHLDRLKTTLDDMGYRTHNPLGEPFSETRTDCQASIAGDSTQHLVITDVIKPIIYHQTDAQPTIVQLGVVIVAQP